MLKQLDASEVRAAPSSSSTPLIVPSSIPLPADLAPSSAPSASVSLTPPSHAGSSSTPLPAVPIIQIDPVTNEDLEDEEGVDIPVSPLGDGSIDWGAVDDEVDAFLNETDDEDEGDEDMADGNASDASGISRGSR